MNTLISKAGVSNSKSNTGLIEEENVSEDKNTEITMRSQFREKRNQDMLFSMLPYF